MLAESAYTDGIVLFNGSNTDAHSRKIYTDWLQRHEGTDRVTGSILLICARPWSITSANKDTSSSLARSPVIFR